MNAQNSVLVICVEAMIYLILYNLQTVPLNNSKTVVLKDKIKMNDDNNHKLKNINMMFSARFDLSQSK